MKVLLVVGMLLMFASCDTSRSLVGAPEKASKTIEPDISIDLTTRLKGYAGVRVLGERANAQIFIGGPSSINGNLEPLYILDGRPVSSYSDLYTMVNTADIKRIEVLKNAIDVAAYGARGANGVIKITTID